jgi:hypothetical protein
LSRALSRVLGDSLLNLPAQASELLVAERDSHQHVRYSCLT